MKLYYNRHAKDPIYYIQEGYRVNSKKTTTRNVYRIGKHSELLAITDDPLSYANQKVQEYNEELEKNGRVRMEVTIDFNKRLAGSTSIVPSTNSRNVGYFFLQVIYHDLHIDTFFQKITEGSKIQYDANCINRFLTFDRILHPGSKLSTVKRLNRYYEQPSFNHENVLHMMDLLSDNYDGYISHLYEYSNRVVKRNASVCYFDCTNFYFEVETYDEDYVDEVTGETIKGLRKYGPSKEHRPNPIATMGLFMDSQGIPLSMCIAPGSDNEQTLAVPVEEKLTKMLKGKKFIYCADAGLGSQTIRQFNAMGGRAFIVTQSVKKLPDKLKLAVFSDCDYRLLSNNEATTISHMKEFDRKAECNLKLYNDRAYKIIPADAQVDLGFYETKTYKNGKTKKIKAKGILDQRIIVTFSRKMMEYQRYIRNRQIERAKKMLEKIDPETYKKGPNDVTRFIKRTSTGEKGEKATDAYFLDQSVIDEEEKYDGFYAVATNLDDDPKEILAIMGQRYKIEDCFRVMKTNFSARPVYHRLPNRIIAHFMICYSALLIFRLLQTKLDIYGKQFDPPKHFTTDDIIETLRLMDIVDNDGRYLMANYSNSQIVTALNDIFRLELDRVYYKPKDLSKKVKKIL